ncbi:MmgE/PrpD family protein [Thermodesulfobacteriota bacterium]
MKKNYVANELADYALNLNYNDIPPEVTKRTKTVILDTIGTALVGSEMPWAKAVYQFVLDQGGNGESSICRYGDKTSCSYAAFVNGTFSHSQDFDDQYAYGPLHPSAQVWVAIPLGERLKASGKDIIVSTVLGYDLTVRLAEACFSVPAGERALTNRGFQGQAVCGTLAAAAQAGKMIGLDNEKIASAIGIACSYPGGIIEFLKDGTDTKRFHFGKASQQGITSAFLSKNGFKGPQSGIEGPRGFLHAYSGDYDISKVTEELGNRFDIMQSTIKHYPIMYGNQTAVEALLYIMDKYKIVSSEIDIIYVKIRSIFAAYGISYFGETHTKYKPPTRLAAEMSLPYALAIAALEGDIRLEHLEDNKRNDPRLLELASRVNVEAISEFDNLSRQDAYAPSRVTVITKDGKEFTETRYHPKGDPRNPLTKSEILDKFRDNVSRVNMKKKQIEQIIQLVSKLDEVNDINELTRLFKIQN